MSGTTSSASSGDGQFQAGNGQIIDPSGNVFTARGIGLEDSEMGDANQILADFPGLNFVNLAVYSYQSPSAYASFIQTMTSHGVVVELEDHSNNAGNTGGGNGTIFTGSDLSNELNWYSSVASAFASNPNVWFGTDNEPSDVDSSGNQNLTALAQWQLQTEQAIRNAGNNSPVLLEPSYDYNGAGSMNGALPQSVYSQMTNTVWDLHFYGWNAGYTPQTPNAGYSTDQSVANATLSTLVSQAQQITSANGVMPVLDAEYGISTNGSTPDPNANQVLQAVQQSNQTSGSAAWGFSAGGDNLTDGNGNLTSYGQEVAQWIASGAQNGTAASTSAASTGSSTGAEAPGNTITFSQNNAWQSAVTGDTAFFINGSNNTIDLSGGSGTVTDNGGSNTFILPAASTGSATFTNDILSLGDTINLQTALAATDWDGSASDLNNYLSVTDTSSGATLSIAPTSGGSSAPIATIAGETSLDLNGLLSHAIT